MSDLRPCPTHSCRSRRVAYDEELKAVRCAICGKRGSSGHDEPSATNYWNWLDRDGGFAFASGDPANGGEVGMTLRQYLAGAALPVARAMFSQHALVTPKDVASKAVEIADEVLIMLEETKNG